MIHSLWDSRLPKLPDNRLCRKARKFYHPQLHLGWTIVGFIFRSTKQANRYSHSQPLDLKHWTGDLCPVGHYQSTGSDFIFLPLWPYTLKSTRVPQVSIHVTRQNHVYLFLCTTPHHRSYLVPHPLGFCWNRAQRQDAAFPLPNNSYLLPTSVVPWSILSVDEANQFIQFVHRQPAGGEPQVGGMQEGLRTAPSRARNTFHFRKTFLRQLCLSNDPQSPTLIRSP